MQFNYQEVKNAFQQKKVKNVFYLKFCSTLWKNWHFQTQVQLQELQEENILFFITTVLTSWEFSLRDLVGQYICMLHQTGFIVLCFSAKQMCGTIKYTLTALLYRHQISELEIHSFKKNSLWYNMCRYRDNHGFKKALLFAGWK